MSPLKPSNYGVSSLKGSPLINMCLYFKSSLPALSKIKSFIKKMISIQTHWPVCVVRFLQGKPLNYSLLLLRLIQFPHSLPVLHQGVLGCQLHDQSFKLTIPLLGCMQFNGLPSSPSPLSSYVAQSPSDSSTGALINLSPGFSLPHQFFPSGGVLMQWTLPPLLNFRRSANLRKFLGYLTAPAGCTW